MKRLKPDRCGYSGYVCVGIPPLSDPYKHTKFVADEEAARIGAFEPRFSDGTEDSVKWNWIDNYLNLPTMVGGPTMELPVLPDMGILQGRRDSMGGWVCGSTTMCLRPMEIYGRWIYNPANVSEAYDSVQIPASTDKEGDTWHNLPAALCFTDTPNTSLDPEEQDPGEEHALLPAPLDFPVDVDREQTSSTVPSAYEAPMDGLVVALDRVQKWNDVVEDQLNELSARYISAECTLVTSVVPDLSTISQQVAGILNLLEVMNTTSACDTNFKIMLVSGDVLQTDLQSDVIPPTYAISSGTIYINGAAVNVNGLSSLTPPFYIYLNISYSAGITAVLTTSPSGTYSLGIGGVRLIQSIDGSHTDAAPYALWTIQQERCTVSLDMIRTSSGVLFRLSDGSAMPYTALPTATCPPRS